MGVKKGENWGTAGSLPAGSPVAASDLALRAIVSAAFRANVEPPVVGLIGGDLAATLGSPRNRDRLDSPDAQTLRIDVGEVRLDDGEPFYFVSHLVARRSWLFGRVLAVANAAWMGEWNIAPRSHPGDGRMDLLDCTMNLKDRVKARSRLLHGDHVPHPGIETRRLRDFDVAFERPQRVFLDGECVGSARKLSVVVLPSALTVVV